MSIFTEIKKDHRELAAMLRELCTLNPRDEFRYILIPEIHNLIISHDRSEERTLYFEARKLGEKGKEIYSRGLGEHLEIEAASYALLTADRLSASWKPWARKLKNMVESNISREERDLFEITKRSLTGAELNKLGSQFATLRKSFSNRGGFANAAELAANLFAPGLRDRLP